MGFPPLISEKHCYSIGSSLGKIHRLNIAISDVKKENNDAIIYNWQQFLVKGKAFKASWIDIYTKMINKEIEYKSILMRCDNVNPNAFIALDPNLTMEFYSSDMESIWIKIQKSVGEFTGYSDKEIYTYFRDKFMVYKEQLMQRCIFIKDRKSGTYWNLLCMV